MYSIKITPHIWFVILHEQNKNFYVMIYEKI